MYYAVLPGQCIDIPMLEDTTNLNFLGWYYVDTNGPFDANAPITEDIQIYAKWQDNALNKTDNIIKLIPLGIFSIMFVVIFAVAIKRIKRERVKKDVPKR